MELHREAIRTAKTALFTAWALLGLFVLTTTVVDHPLRGTLIQRRQVLSWTPQGWAFFTRSPREPVLRAYRFSGNEWRNALVSNASYRNVLGVSRRARATNTELHAIAARVPESRWFACAEALDTCAAEIAYDPMKIANPAPGPGLCGLLIIEQRPLVPWAWSASRDQVFMPGSVASVFVECGDAT